MNQNRNIYVCPETKLPLSCVVDEVKGFEAVSGKLVAENGREYEIKDGIPDLIFPKILSTEGKDALNYYESVASIYDDVAYLSFRIQYVDEEEARKEFVQQLNLQPGSRVLELACGTGRDSVIIAKELDSTGQLYLQDISRSMLLQCKSKLSEAQVPVEYSVGNACNLSFPDKYFDAVFSFGGLGVFGNIKQSLKEMVRVSKVGAKILVGDESMPPWLYDSEYGKILLNNNPLFKNPIPFDQLPVEARDVMVRWIIGGVYYIIRFTVGEGEPRADFNFEIPGRRGGTLRTRYYGKLEGVSEETFNLAQKAREKSGKSMHKWLDEIVKDAAKKQLCIS